MGWVLLLPPHFQTLLLAGCHQQGKTREVACHQSPTLSQTITLRSKNNKSEKNLERKKVTHSTGSLHHPHLPRVSYHLPSPPPNHEPATGALTSLWLHPHQPYLRDNHWGRPQPATAAAPRCTTSGASASEVPLQCTSHV